MTPKGVEPIMGIQPEITRYTWSSNHNGDDGGTQTGTRSEVQWRSGWEPNVGAQNPKCKHHTEDEGGTVELPWNILELRPGDW